MEEIYKDILGYEGLYQVSNHGNVKSLPKGDGNGNRERLLKFDVSHRSSTNYYRVTLSKDSKTKRFQVHQLVGLMFIPNPDNKSLINHIDNDGTHNNVRNLEWCTHIENMEHSSKQGRQDKPRSMGGLASAISREISGDKFNMSLIGKTIGELTIIDYYRDSTLVKNKSPKFICICTCGNKVERLKYNLLSEARPKMCNECALKQRKKIKI